MAIKPNIPTTSLPEGQPSRLRRYARRAGAAVLAAIVIVPGAEVVREAGMYELKDKPALKDKVNDVKQHQNNLRSIVEDAYYKSGSARASGVPYDAAAVRQYRKALKKTGSVEAAVPPVVTYEEFKGGGSSTTQHFSSEASRQASVKAIGDTIRATSDTKLNKKGLDDIYARYQQEIGEERGIAVRREEAAISAGLQTVAEKFDDTLDDKPILVGQDYADNLEKSVGLMTTDQGLYTAEYPKNSNRFTSPDDILPNTFQDVASQLPGSVQAEDLKISLPPKR